MEGALLRLELQTQVVQDELRKLRLLMMIQNQSDFIFKINNVRWRALNPKTPPILFFLPDALTDFVQSQIVLEGNFFDYPTISAADAFFNNGAHILDLGANVGNNALYYALVRQAKSVVAFEPLLDVFAILQKNIALNHLENVIAAHNVALGEKNTQAEIMERPPANLGGSCLKESHQGNIVVHHLDGMDFANRIDFVKIDVEGFESSVLKGGLRFFNTHKPVVQIESHPDKYADMQQMMESLNYQRIQQIGVADYIFASI